MKIRLKKVLKLCCHIEEIDLFDCSNCKTLLENEVRSTIPKKYLNWYVLEINAVSDCHTAFSIIEPKNYRKYNNVMVICPKCGCSTIYKNWFDWVLHTPIHWFSKRRTKCSHCGIIFYGKRVTGD